MDISKAILNVREKKGIKQSEMAKELNIEQSNYSRLEKRGDKMTIEQLKSIANVLNVSPVELLNSSDIVPNKNANDRILELEEKTKELQEELVDKEERLQLYADLTSVRKENARLHYEKYKYLKSRLKETEDPLLEVLDSMLSFIASLGGIEEND